MNDISWETGYTVQDIMIQEHEIVSWEFGTTHINTVTAARNYKLTFVPVKEAGHYTAITTTESLATGKPDLEYLTYDWLVAVNTPILQLIRLFAETENKRRTFLVLGNREIVGLVAPADLNKTPARASVYLLVANFEYELANLLRTYANKDRVLASAQNRARPERVQELQEIGEREHSEDIELDLIQYLYIDELTYAALNEPEVIARLGYADREEAKELTFSSDVRNQIAHPTRPLITSPEATVAVHEACERLINLNARIQRALGAKRQ